jgi:hypothetical protein
MAIKTVETNIEEGNVCLQNKQGIWKGWKMPQSWLEQLNCRMLLCMSVLLIEKGQHKSVKYFISYSIILPLN